MQYHHLFSQTTRHQLQDSLVARFNRNDFQGFYDLGSLGLEAKVQAREDHLMARLFKAADRQYQNLGAHPGFG